MAKCYDTAHPQLAAFLTCYSEQKGSNFLWNETMHHGLTLCGALVQRNK